MNKPRLRFKGFNDKWTKVNLSNLSRIYDGTHQTPIYTTHGVPFVSAENIDDLYNTKKHISKDDFEKIYKNSKPKNRDLLMTRIGKIGKVNKINRNSPLAYYVTLALIKIKKEIDSNYLMYNIQSEKFQKELWAKTLHIAFPPKINKNEISKINTFITSYNEQEKIGLFFEKLDQLIQLQSDKLEHLKITKKGYLQKIFINKFNNIPKLRFKEFDDSWNEKQVDHLFKVTRGNVLSKNKITNIQDKFNTYPVYSSQTANNGLLGYYKDYLYEDAITWTTDGANAGTVMFRRGRFFSTNVNGVLLSSKGYANKATSSIINSIAFKYVSHVGNPKLMNNTMKKIKIMIPKVKEQQRLSNFIDNLDQQITLQQQKLDNLKQQKKAYLQKMFI